MPISATEQSWNSATTLYLARKLDQLSQSKQRQLRVLDLGSGAGKTIQAFHQYGHELYGYDDNEPVLRQNLEPLFGADFDNRIRIMTNDRVIPFEDNFFDVVYANQVFEHVRYLDQLVSECARILKPNGIVITLFPLATLPFEAHNKIPFVHWLPPGKFRVQYMAMFYRLGLRPKSPNKTAYETAQEWEHFLKYLVFYRFMNEVVIISDTYFHSWELDTRDYIRAKLDLLKINPTWRNRLVWFLGSILQSKLLDDLVTHYWCGVFCMKNPKPPEEYGIPYYRET